jgi:Spy/CpxP family protein refolding chaperone
MRIWKRTGHWGTTALLALTFGFSACDEAVTDLTDDTLGQEAAVGDVTGLLAGVTEGLSLTSSQTVAVNELAASFGERMGEPGALWRLAGELHGTLTAEQIAHIVDRQAERLEQMAGRAGDGPPGFGRRHGGPGGGFGRGLRSGAGKFLPDATDEQRQAIREVLESLRPQFEALHEQLRSGQITSEEFRAQAQELREAAHAKIDPLLTDEQRVRSPSSRRSKSNG